MVSRFLLMVIFAIALTSIGCSIAHQSGVECPTCHTGCSNCEVRFHNNAGKQVSLYENISFPPSWRRESVSDTGFVLDYSPIIQGLVEKIADLDGMQPTKYYQEIFVNQFFYADGFICIVSQDKKLLDDMVRNYLESLHSIHGSALANIGVSREMNNDCITYELSTEKYDISVAIQSVSNIENLNVDHVDKELRMKVTIECLLSLPKIGVPSKNPG